MDRAAFLADDFDVKAWINQACGDRQSRDELSRYLPELEMKVQLAAEDVEQQMHDLTSTIAARVAATAEEAGHMRAELAALDTLVDDLAQRASAHERRYTSDVFRLQGLDAVKGRVLAAKSTLKEASTLADVYHSLGGLLDSGELGQLLAALGTMRGSMAAVAKVPEFVGVADKVAMLEARIKDLAVADLSGAVSARDSERMQRAWEALSQIDKVDLAQEVYVRHVCDAVQGPLERARSASESDVQVWLPVWHREVQTAVAAERGWIAQVLPHQADALFLQALAVALKSSAALVHSGLAQLTQPHEQLMDVLVACLSDTTQCCSALAAQLPYTPVAVLSSLLHPLMQPFEPFMDGYARLEAAFLEQQAFAVPDAASGSGTLSTAIDRLSEAAGGLDVFARDAMKRCLDFTAGVELAELISPLDTSLRRRVDGLAARVKALATDVTGVSPDGPAAHGGERAVLAAELDQDTLAQVLRLPLVCSSMRSSVGRVDTDVRTQAAALAPLVKAARTEDAGEIRVSAAGIASGTQVDMLVWRLGTAAQVRKLEALERAVEGVLFAHTAVALDAADDTVERSLLQALAAPAMRPLQEMDQLAARWAEDGSEGELATFAPYPSAFSTNTGEALIMLPQQLEVLVAEGEQGNGDAGAAGGELAGQWLDKVASSVAQALTDRVMSIARLGAKGSLQLGADLEYVCNVIGALGVALPPALATACTLATVTTESAFRKMAQAGMADGSLDRHACKVLAKMRGWALQ